MTPPARTARAVISQRGSWLGALAPFPVPTPWWADVEPVTSHLTELLGVPATVLRLVDVAGGVAPAGGLATYHAELDAPPPVDPGWQRIGAGELAELGQPQPRRTRHAEPGGPAEHLRWADASLDGIGRPRTGPPVQVKTWNLSCVYRVPTASGAAWLKCISGWQTPEDVVLAAVAAVDPDLVPTVVAADPGACRVLVDHVRGGDCYDPSQASVEQAVDRWVAVQAELASDEHRRRLVTGGCHDWPLATLGQRLAAALAEAPGALPRFERTMLLELLDELPGRLAALADAGLPDTLVHGDFQGGNWRTDGTDLVVMDWSDASISHPAIDVVSLLASLPAVRRTTTLDRWARRWRSAVPGCDPYAAAALVQPLQALQAALLYQHFLDHIEPSERRYHEGDPAAMVRTAAARVRGGATIDVRTRLGDQAD